MRSEPERPDAAQEPGADAAPAPGPVTVSASDLSVEFASDGGTSRVFAVRGATLEIRQGEILGLIGDAGSGKSALAAAIAGRADGRGRAPRIAGGALTVLGMDLRTVHRRDRARITGMVGYLPQDGGSLLDGGLTIAENVAEPIYLRDRHFDPRSAGRAVATLIDGMHLPLSVLDRHPFELSSGQRQRVALARALILEPRLLVADEPIRGIDLTVRQNIIDVLLSLQRGRPFSALIVSSDLGVVRELATRIAVLDDGILIGDDTLENLVAGPEHPYLVALAETVAAAGPGSRGRDSRPGVVEPALDLAQPEGLIG